MYIQNYDCITAAGEGSENLMKALYSGQDCSQSSPYFPDSRACLIPHLDRQQSYRRNFALLFAKLWQNLQTTMPAEVKSRLAAGAPIALVFSSTKGMLEDFIWSSTQESIRSADDPYQCIIDDFCSAHPEINFSIKVNISNACSSSHLAAEYIQSLFDGGRAELALHLSGDLVGPFVSKGFGALKILSPTSNRPFAEGRDGLQLGDAAVMTLFSKTRLHADDIELARAESSTEGTSITRPSMNGQGLICALKRVQSHVAVNPDLILAHGTGTVFNDLSEDMALRQTLPTVPVTGVKWCVGHTLGASGSVDLVAAIEILKRQKTFPMANTETIDTKFQMAYLKKSSTGPERIHQILINSLGFGGVHASLVLNRGQS